MAFDAVDGPFGGYVNGVNTVSAAAKTEILANCDRLAALLPNSATGVLSSGTLRITDTIRPELEVALRAEIVALKAAINAAP